MKTMASQNGVVFEDFFPAMVEKLGAEGFMKELCNGFQLLVDGDKGVITFESLKRNSALLGLQGMSDEEAICMLREGDLDGDGALNETEFCPTKLDSSIPSVCFQATFTGIESVIRLQK
ncbi:hypothetical protein CRYUN_Cryun32bG0029400 [Craigia yunnanensis]